MIGVLTAACISAAAQRYQVAEPLLWSVMYVEHGRVGAASQNRNGTKDLGPMQINDTHLPALARGAGASKQVVQQYLTNDGCYNVAVGAWILSVEIRQAGDLWTGVGHYHSHNPKRARAYAQKVAQMAIRLFGPNVFRN